MPSGPYSGITINSAKRLLTAQFKAADRDGADYAARALIEKVTTLPKTEQIARGTEFLTGEQFVSLSDLAERYSGGEPLDHILGYREFWKDRFTVSADVLSPRPETEGIIELALELYKDVPPKTILDLGTGSGAILLSLLREFPNANGTGVDLSKAALEIAKANAKALQIKARFAQGSWFDCLAADAQFDQIVSNPPYIDNAAMDELPPEVSDYDPDLALRGGADGLDAYREIIAGAPKHLTKGGWLIVEIGYDQGESVPALFEKSGFANVSVRKDFAGHDRVVSGRKA